MVRNCENADWSLRKQKLWCQSLYFSAHFRSLLIAVRCCCVDRNRPMLFIGPGSAVFVLAPLLGDRGRVAKQSHVRFPAHVQRQTGTEMFQLATKSSGRPQQREPCRQRVPCSRCGDRESTVADSSTCRRHDEVAGRRGTQYRCPIKVGAAGAAALGPFKK